MFLSHETLQDLVSTFLSERWIHRKASERVFENPAGTHVGHMIFDVNIMSPERHSTFKNLNELQRLHFEIN